MSTQPGDSQASLSPNQNPKVPKRKCGPRQEERSVVPRSRLLLPQPFFQPRLLGRTERRMERPAIVDVALVARAGVDRGDEGLEVQGDVGIGRQEGDRNGRQWLGERRRPDGAARRLLLAAPEQVV